MRAVVLERFGGPEELRLREVPDPEPGPGEVRIAVHAAGLNPVDAGNREDGSWAGIDVPCILGYDVAGVIDEVGPGVDNLAAGDRVMAMLGFPAAAGGYAELVVTRAELVAVLDPAVDMIEAAATPLAGGTALDVLDRLSLEAGSSVLTLGASGGVGSFIIQLAAHRGLEVIAVGRTGAHERMLGLGASACIDYTMEDVARRAVELAGGRVDAIVDLVGDPELPRKLTALRARGSIALISSATLDVETILDENLKVHGVLITDDGDRTRALAQLLASGVIRPQVSTTMPLADVAEAHRILDSRHAGGKIVLTMPLTSDV